MRAWAPGTADEVADGVDPSPLLPLDGMMERIGVSYEQLVAEGLEILEAREARAVFSRAQIEYHEDLARHHLAIAAEMTRLNFNWRWEYVRPASGDRLSTDLATLHALERSRLGLGSGGG